MHLAAASASDADAIVSAVASALSAGGMGAADVQRDFVVALATLTRDAPAAAESLLATPPVASLPTPPVFPNALLVVPLLGSPCPLPPLPAAAPHTHPHHAAGRPSHLHPHDLQQQQQQPPHRLQEQRCPAAPDPEGGAAAAAAATVADGPGLLRACAASFHKDYELGELLGRGTFGAVYAAVRRSDGGQVAVKVVPRRGRSGAADSVAREVEFCRELQGCPDVVQLYDVYEDEANVYIVQELCFGGDVDGLLAASGGRLSEAEAAEVMRSVLRFLAHAAERGICVGDVKPANFVLRTIYPSVAHMLDPGCEPKGEITIAATDFGCCQRTVSGKCLPSIPPTGTPAFLAPECFVSHCFGTPSDVWAAGVMLYHLLTGCFPFWAGGPERFHAMSAKALRDGIVHGSVLFPWDPWDALSPHARSLVVAMLEKDPLRRVSAAAAAAHPWFADALRPSAPAASAPGEAVWVTS